jgi:hypothetical protein
MFEVDSLQQHLQGIIRFARLEVAHLPDSRVKGFDVLPYWQIYRRSAYTVPDLDESAEFRDVRL